MDVLQPFSEPIVLESIEEYNPLPRVAHIPYPQLPAQQDVSGATSIAQDGSPANLLARNGQLRGPSVEVEYDESNRASFSPSRFGNSTSLYDLENRTLYVSDWLTTAAGSATHF